MTMRLYPARAADAEVLTPLVLAAAGELLAYSLTLGPYAPGDYVQVALQSPGGVLGHRYLYVIEEDGRQIGCISAYPARARGRIFAETAWKVFQFYGLRYGAVFSARSVRLGPMTVYPPRSALCIAHCAIVPEMRRRGLFRQALETVLAMHQDGGFTELSLEVAETNVGAVRVYESLGFEVVTSVPSVVKGLPGLFRMARPMPLASGA